MARPDSRSPEFVALLSLTALAVLPLWMGRFLPLYDYPAHLVIPAVLLRWDDPTTQALYVATPGLNPNSLHYAFTWLLGHVVSVEVASKVFLSLALLALPWAMVFALRTFGRDFRLVVLALPLCYGRGFWYGFVGFCAALPLALVALSLTWKLVSTPSPRRRTAVLLLVVMVVFPFAHFFVMAATFGVGLMLVLLAARRGGAAVARRAWPLLGGPLVMAPWVLSRVTGTSAPGSTGPGGPLFTRPPLGEYLAMAQHWFLDGYVASFDEWLAAGMVVTLAALMGVGRLWAASSPEADRTAPVVAGLTFAAAYVLLPFELNRPFQWWAMNVRMLPLAFLWLVVACPGSRLSVWGRWALAPLWVGTAAYFLFIASDFRRFNDEEAGLSEALAALPRGAQVQTVLTDYRGPMHYSHSPNFYAGAWAVANGAGTSAPFPPIPQGWVNARETPETPIAGDSAFFDPSRHLAGFTHFLVRVCSEPGCLPDPLERVSVVQRIVDAGHWRTYACTGAPCRRLPQ